MLHLQLCLRLSEHPDSCQAVQNQIYTANLAVQKSLQGIKNCGQAAASRDRHLNLQQQQTVEAFMLRAKSGWERQSDSEFRNITGASLVHRCQALASYRQIYLQSSTFATIVFLKHTHSTIRSSLFCNYVPMPAWYEWMKGYHFHFVIW